MTRTSPSSRIGSRPCCIVGGGPAGLMLGYLLARAGVAVRVLEKHGDFLRDFRGDTVHPSTLEVLRQTGLLERFYGLPHRRVDHLGVHVGGRLQPLIDFRGLRPFDHLCLVPQWDFLNLLAEEARRFPGFELRMRHEATDLLWSEGEVAGVRVRTPEGEQELGACLVVACDGRNSLIREAAKLRVREFGAPVDVLWFRLERRPEHPEETFALVGAGHMMVLLNRTDYWQAAYLVPKGGAEGFRKQHIETLRRSVRESAPFLELETAALDSWERVKTLEVRVDRLERWHRPGLLLIGDAAHAMSPVGGVGINLAVQDAVAAANILWRPLRCGDRVGQEVLRRVQKRRLPPTVLIQAVQLQVQKRIIARILEESSAPPRIPALLRALLRFRAVRRIPARLMGYGIRRERVRSP